MDEVVEETVIISDVKEELISPVKAELSVERVKLAETAFDEVIKKEMVKDELEKQNFVEKVEIQDIVGVPPRIEITFTLEGDNNVRGFITALMNDATYIDGFSLITLEDGRKKFFSESMKNIDNIKKAGAL